MNHFSWRHLTRRLDVIVLNVYRWFVVIARSVSETDAWINRRITCMRSDRRRFLSRWIWWEYGNGYSRPWSKSSRFLDRCDQRNLHLNVDKIQLRVIEVPFIGHTATANVLKPGPEKIEAILKMPAPVDTAGVRRLLGMITYLEKFMPNLSQLTSPWRKLTHRRRMELGWRTRESVWENQAGGCTPEILVLTMMLH